MLELAADLGLLDEPADELRTLAVLVEQDLDSQLASQVRVPSPEDRPHAAPRDLTEELVTTGLAGPVGSFGAASRRHRRIAVELVVAQHDTRHRAELFG